LSWAIEITKSAKKDLARIDKKDAQRLVKFLRERVASDPVSIGKALTAEFSGLWRYRVGQYRIVCEIQNSTKVVLVLRIAHCKDVYR